MKYYAGIGSRQTPESLREKIHRISLFLKSKDYILRSGGAPGADTMFEEKIEVTHKEIFLPWKGFNNNNSNVFNVDNEALYLAEKFHPNWNALSQGAQKLMARNCYQVLGKNLKTPVDFIICYTKDGKSSGGTGQALRIARLHKIKVFNLFNDVENEIFNFCTIPKKLF